MFDITNYRKEVKLSDGSKVLLRPMVAEDKDALFDFFKKVPNEEARYLRDDVSNRLLIEKWAADIDYNKTLPVLAVKGKAVIADATLNRRRSGWKWHLGTVRIFVHQDYRKVGLGRLMIEEISNIADKLGLEKLIAEVPDTNIPALNAFEKAKYHRVAVIQDLVKDRDNRPLDVVVMIRNLKPIYVEEHEYDLL